MMNNTDRFTQRTKRVLTLAEEAAVQLKHAIVGTEHILLGLLREENGVASRVLRDLGLGYKRVAEFIVEITPAGKDTLPVNDTQLSVEAQTLIDLAIDEARRLDHHYIGTEHILLGLIRQEESMAVRILQRFDISAEQVHRETQQMLQEPSPQMIVPPSKNEPDPSPNDDTPTQPQLNSDSSDMAMAIVSKILGMVSNNKLTTSQATELLRALHLDLSLSSTGKARFASMVNRSPEDAKRRVRITISNTITKQPQFEIVNSLDLVLSFIDHFLRLVADNELESLVFDGDSTPISTEMRIERDDSNP